ncbi:uncharacterized protein L201_002529 [Kwoniella dendrophila CBS 6074]|uniref:Uncharacterized protein n=1 Tax=Kwoniella dendrophila CBS 6074 TaxID=1295534 RepID=A0AAX4JSA3_9TREE
MLGIDYGNRSTIGLATESGLNLDQDAFFHVLSILQAQSKFSTLATLQLCSRAHYSAIAPYLYRNLVLHEKGITSLLGQTLRWNKGEGHSLFRTIKYAESITPSKDAKDILDLGSSPSVHHPAPIRFKINLSYVRNITLKYDADEPSELSPDLEKVVSLLSHYQNYTGQYLFPSLECISCVGKPKNDLELGEIWTLLSSLCSPQHLCFKWTHPFLYSNSTFAALESFDWTVRSITVHSAMPSWIPRSHNDVTVKISYASLSCDEGCDGEDGDEDETHQYKSCERFQKENIAKWLIAGPRSNKGRWRGEWSIHTSLEPGGISSKQDLEEIRLICMGMLEELQSGASIGDGGGWTLEAVSNARHFIEKISWVVAGRNTEEEICKTCRSELL